MTCEAQSNRDARDVAQAAAHAARNRPMPLARPMSPLGFYWRRQSNLEDAFGHLGMWGRDGLPRW